MTETGRPTARSEAPAPGASPPRGGTHRPSPPPPPFASRRTEELRKITYLMLFRVGLVTILLVAIVVSHALGPRPERLAQPFSLFLFGLIVLTYGLTLVYARLLYRVGRPERLAFLQIGADLVVTSVLVHATGGAESAFTFLYALSIIGAAMVLPPRGALATTVVCMLLYVGVAALGLAGTLPPVLGQPVVAQAVTPQEFGRALVINLAAMAAVAVLASDLGVQLQRAGERLAHQQARFSDLAAQSEDVIRCLTSGLVTVDRRERVTTFNAAAAEITGIEETAALGQPLVDLLPELTTLPDDAQGAHRLEVAVTAADGTVVPLGVSVSHLTDRRSEVVGRIFSFQDLSELKQMEHAVKRAERLATLGQLSASMAHEIRNPLASISGSIELLRAGLAVDGEDRKLVDIVVREVERLNQLIGDLLTLARPGQGTRTRMNLTQLLRDTLTVFEHGQQGGVTPHLDAPEPVWVEADPGQIRQVVWNLLTNASEAMPDGGRLDLRLKEDHGDGPPAAVLEISDEGTGIAAEHLEGLFEPFFTTKSRGSGLGLALVQRIVEDHAGSVEITSALGTGTTVTVRLPTAEDGS